jgi:ribosomal protein S6
MNKYELVLIVDAQHPAGEKEKIVQQAADAVVKSGGRVINSQLWIEKQKFSFKIKQIVEGTYYMINFESSATVVVNIRQGLKAHDGILRFAIIRA